MDLPLFDELAQTENMLRVRSSTVVLSSRALQGRLLPKSVSSENEHVFEEKVLNLLTKGSMLGKTKRGTYMYHPLLETRLHAYPDRALVCEHFARKG